MPRLVRVTGFRKVQANLQSARRHCVEGANQGIINATLFLLEESQKIVPVDTGDLRASGRANFTRVGHRVTGRVTYNTEYAVYVHEDLEAYHEPPTTAKYLERPAREKADEIRRIVRDEVHLEKSGLPPFKGRVPAHGRRKK